MQRIFIIFFSLLSFSLKAQFDADVKKHTFERTFKVSFHTKPKLDIKFDNRFSFIRANDVKTIGIKVGVSFNRKFKIGLGINSMILPSTNRIINDGDTLHVQLAYTYFSPYIEYVYYSSKKWEYMLSAQFGLGGASQNYIDAAGQKQKIHQTTILSYEPAMLIDYKIIKWFGIGTGIGYRLVFYKKGNIQQKFSSPEYVLKLNVYLGEIYRTITGRELPIPAE